MRTTDDDRLLAGGEDRVFPRALARDRLLPSRLGAIEAAARNRFWRLDSAVEFGGTGAFAETFDGPSFIGRHAERQGTSFTLCFGGRGITNSAIAADLIPADVVGKRHPLADLMGFQRAAKRLAVADRA